MAEWKSQLSYNYHHHAAGGLYAAAAYGYGAYMYHQPGVVPEQNTGATAWTDPGHVAAELANHHPGMTHASHYNPAAAVTGAREAASPPESSAAAHVVGNGHHHHHYPGSQGVIQYYSNPQTGHVYMAQNRDPYEKAWAHHRPATPTSDSESHASPDSLSPRCSSRDGGLPQADPVAWTGRDIDGATARDSVSPDNPEPTHDADSWSSGSKRGLPQTDPVAWSRQTWSRQYLDGGRDSVSPLPDDPKPTLETDSWSYGCHARERGLPYADPVAWTIRELDARRDSVSPLPDDPKPTLDTDSWSAGCNARERGLPQTDPVAWTVRDVDGATARDSVSPDNPEPTHDADSWSSGSKRGLPQTDPVAWTIRDLDGATARDSVIPDNPEPTHNTDSWSSGSNASERGLPQAHPVDWTRKDLDDGRDSLSPDTREQVPVSLFTEKLNIPTTIGDIPNAPDPIHAPLSTPKKRGKRAKAAGNAVRPRALSRSAFSESQMDTLMRRFNAKRYLTPAEMKELGEVTGLSYKQVKTWFQNRRMKMRRHLKDGEWDISLKKSSKKTSPNASPNPALDTNNIQTDREGPSQDHGYRLKYQEEVFRAKLQEQYNQQMVSAYNQNPGQNLAYYQYLAAMGGYSTWPSASSQPDHLPTSWNTLNPSPAQTTHYEYSTATAGNSSGNTSIDSDDVVDLSIHGGASQ